MIDPQIYYKLFLDEDRPKDKLLEMIRKNLAEGEEPLDIINKGLIPALDVIGIQFSKGTLYLPELIFAGKVMQESLALLRPKSKINNDQNLGTILLGTVKGDLHDIGKNLVGMIAEISGFNVVDLGINVSSDKYLDSIEAYHPKFVGLSALLTTTMLEMKKTVGLIKGSEIGKSTMVIVGGAPLTEEFAKGIGADGFGEDAVDGVMKMKSMLGIQNISRFEDRWQV